jgi:hypothetical protein
MIKGKDQLQLPQTRCILPFSVDDSTHTAACKLSGARKLESATPGGGILGTGNPSLLLRTTHHKTNHSGFRRRHNSSSQSINSSPHHVTVPVILCSRKRVTRDEIGGGTVRERHSAGTRPDLPSPTQLAHRSATLTSICLAEKPLDLPAASPLIGCLVLPRSTSQQLNCTTLCSSRCLKAAEDADPIQSPLGPLLRPACPFSRRWARTDTSTIVDCLSS